MAASEADKAKFREQMAQTSNVEFGLEGARKLLKEFPKALPIINSHVHAKSGIAHMESYFSDETIPVEQRTVTSKEIYIAMLRWKASAAGTKALPDGKNWSSGLLKSMEPTAIDGLLDDAAPVAPPPPEVAESEVDTLSAAAFGASEPTKPAPKAVKPVVMVDAVPAGMTPQMAAMMKLMQEMAPPAPVGAGMDAAEIAAIVEHRLAAIIPKLTEEITAGRQLVDDALAKVTASIKGMEAATKKASITLPEAEMKALVAKALKSEVITLMGDVIAGKAVSTSPVVEAEEVIDDATLESGLYHPKPDKTYITSASLDRLFRHINTLRATAPQNVAVVGPTGCGKTTLAIEFAARNKLGILIMDCANVREPRDWFGYRTINGGRVTWHASLFDQAITKGNVVIVFDELPRVSPSVLNTLFPLLDDRRFTYLEEKGGTVRVGPGTVFFATMNEGYSYTGNTTLDAALVDRFARRVEVDYLPPAQEAKVLVNRTGIDEDNAAKLVDLALTVRKKAVGLGATLTKTISTRQLIAAANELKSLGDEGLRYCLSNHFPAEGGETGERAQVLQLLQGKGFVKAK